MDTDTLFQNAEKQLQALIVETKRPDPNRLDVFVTPANLLAAVKGLIEAHWTHLSAITGLDHPAPAPLQPVAKPGEPVVETPAPQTPPAEGKLEVLYQFCQGPAV